MASLIRHMAVDTHRRLIPAIPMVEDIYHGGHSKCSRKGRLVLLILMVEDMYHRRHNKRSNQGRLVPVILMAEDTYLDNIERTT